MLEAASNLKKLFFRTTIIWKFWCCMKLYLIGVWSLVTQIMEPHRDPTKDLPGDLSGQVVVVTGGSRGIGLEVAKAMLRKNATVVIAGVSMATTDMKSLKEEFPSGKVEFMVLNLASFKSVTKFVGDFNQKHSNLNILVNNAGVMLIPFKLTEDGFEQHMGINYLGHALLTHLLLPRLRTSGTASKSARVINVSSTTELVADDNVQFWFDSASNHYSSHASYANSKLAIILATYQLHRTLREDNSHVTVNCLHPGVVNTGLYDNLHWCIGWIFRLLAPYAFKSPRQGSDTVLHVALSPWIEGQGGLYFENSSPKASSQLSYSTCLQQQLWERTSNVLSPYLEKSSMLKK